MADNFDAEEILYEIIKNCGVPVWMGRTARDEQGEHVVVRAIVGNNQAVVNVIPVAVNVFVPKPSGGLINRTRLKAIRTSIQSLVSAATMPTGYYCVIDPKFSKPLDDAKKDFDCYSIRYEIILNT